MAIILEQHIPGGGRVRLHDDCLPKTDAERELAVRRFEMTVASLIRQGKIILDDIAPGSEVECRLTID